MIYIIGGAPRCGKSILAKELVKKTGYSLLSTDTLQKAIRPYIPEPEQAARIPFHHFEEQSDYDNDVMYSKYTTDELVAAYITQAKTYWLGFERLILHCLKSEQNYVIEGHVLHPAFIDAISAPPDILKALYLYKSDASAIANSMLDHPTLHDWAIERSRDAVTLEKIAFVVYSYGKYLHQQADLYKLPSHNTDNFDPAIRAILEGIQI